MNRGLQVVAVSAALLLGCNHRPDMPAITDGPTDIASQDTHAFAAVAIDPDGDSICYRFDWGDGEITDFSGLTGSGMPEVMPHAWKAGGIYYVMAEARDSRGALSGFGLPLEVYVDRYPAPAGPFGPATGLPGALCVFSTMLDYPLACRVRYVFDWGGEQDTTPWFDSPYDTAAVSRRWMDNGTHSLRIRAVDENGGHSPWTGRHTIRIDQAPLLKWRYQTGGNVRSSPAIRPDGVILVGSNDDCLHAVTWVGAKLWTCDAKGCGDRTPAVGPDGVAYIAVSGLRTGECGLAAIDPDGVMPWQTDTIGVVESSAALSRDSAIYIGSNNRYLYATNMEGDRRWRFETDSRLRSSPSINLAGVVHIGCDNDQLFAVHEYCFLKWRFDCAGNPRTSPAIGADGTVYFGSDGGLLYAVTEDGALRWDCEIGEGTPVRSSPAVGPDGMVYFGSDVGCLLAVDSTGTIRWGCLTGDKIQSSPAIAADGTVYVGSDDGWVYAVEPGGTLKWRFQTGGWVRSSPAIGDDGTVYIGSDDNYLYALRGESGPADSPWPMYRHDNRRTGRAGALP